MAISSGVVNILGVDGVPAKSFHIARSGLQRSSLTLLLWGEEAGALTAEVSEEPAQAEDPAPQPEHAEQPMDVGPPPVSGRPGPAPAE